MTSLEGWDSAIELRPQIGYEINRAGGADRRYEEAPDDDGVMPGHRPRSIAAAPNYPPVSEKC